MNRNAILTQALLDIQDEARRGKKANDYGAHIVILRIERLANDAMRDILALPGNADVEETADGGLLITADPGE